MESGVNGGRCKDAGEGDGDMLMVGDGGDEIRSGTYMGDAGIRRVEAGWSMASGCDRSDNSHSISPTSSNMR